jgi:hypothetical protein
MARKELRLSLVRSLIVSMVLVVLFYQDLQAQSRVIEPKSRALWGASKTNCSDGTNVYLGAGGTVIIGRIISTDSIKILNEYYLPSTVQDLSVRGNTLFVSDLLTGLHIIDVTDLFHPHEIAKLSFPHRSYGLLLDSTNLYVSHGEDGVSKVDISSRTNPVLLDGAGYPCTHFGIYSNYVYCINQDRITIAARSSLDSVGSLPLRILTGFGNQIVGLEFSKSKGILVEDYSGEVPGQAWSVLTLLDLSILTNPTRSGTLRLSSQTSFKNRGDTVLCLTQDSIFTVDVNSIIRPSIISRTRGITADFVSLRDTMLFASSDSYSGFQLVTIKDIVHPRNGFHLSTLADIGPVVATDSFLVAGRFENAGLLLVDIGDVFNPRTKCEYKDSIGSVRDLRLGNGHIFAASQQGLKVFDLVGRDGLKLIGTLNYGGWATRLDVSDTLAALGGGYSPIHLISIADPTNPKYLLQIPSSSFGYVEDIFLRDTLLFICGDYAGIRIYTVSSPNYPVTLWEKYFSTCGAIYPLGRTLFVADYATLRAFDISNVKNPTELGSFDLGRRITNICVKDSLAFVSVFSNGYSENNGMVILDVSSLNSIKEVARANTPGWSTAVFANTRNVFLSDHLDGVYIYDRSEIVTNVADHSDNIPNGFRLLQNYPNPFNPTTAISYQLAAIGMVTLKIFDVLGREVSTLVNEIARPGVYKVQWDGSGLPSGIYFYRLQAGEYVETRKMVLIR